MILNYARWLQGCTEEESLRDFLQSYLKGKTDAQVFIDISTELYNQALVLSHTVNEVNILKEKLNGQTDTKDREGKQKRGKSPQKAGVTGQKAR